MLDSHCLNVFVVLHLRQRFSKWIGYIVIRSHFANSDFTLCLPFSNYVKSPLDMFDLLMFSWLSSLSNSSIVVTMEVYWTLDGGYNTKFINELANPNCLLGCLRCCQVLGFSCKISGCALFCTLLTKRSFIET